MRVVELFAGVGGFRKGLEDADSAVFQTVWWNQWEPKTKVQHAWQCYVERFHSGDAAQAPTDSNQDICEVARNGKIPQHDLLVGGFPCQDYSVATTLDKAGGLQGKKGVLWWQIDKILETKEPKFVLLENVDRLLKSPASQRGRDFGVVLSCLNRLGYVAEWRVINAADYGNAQRRRRVFIFAARKGTGIARRIQKNAASSTYLYTDGFFPSQFPVSYELLEKSTLAPHGVLDSDPRAVSRDFEYLFQNAGVMVDGRFWTRQITPKTEAQAVLGKHVHDGPVPDAYFLDDTRLADWKYQKGPKREERRAKNGHVYFYAEGGMQFPDLRNAPARTILTSEGNRTPNRSTHVIKDPETGKLRFLLPVEVERLMGFPSGWTEGLPERWRYFTMGNALVVPLVTRMGNGLIEWIKTWETKAVAEELTGAQPNPKTKKVPRKVRA